MKKLELNQMENLEGGKFWGWQEVGYDCTNGVSSTSYNYQVFGINTGGTKVVYGLC